MTHVADNMPLHLPWAAVQKRKAHVYYRCGRWWAVSPGLAWGHETSVLGPFKTPLMGWGE